MIRIVANYRIDDYARQLIDAICTDVERSVATADAMKYNCQVTKYLFQTAKR